MLDPSVDTSHGRGRRGLLLFVPQKSEGVTFPGFPGYTVHSLSETSFSEESFLENVSSSYPSRTRVPAFISSVAAKKSPVKWYGNDQPDFIGSESLREGMGCGL